MLEVRAAIDASLLFLNRVVFKCCDPQYGIDSRIPVPVPLCACVGWPRSLYPEVISVKTVLIVVSLLSSFYMYVYIICMIGSRL